MDGAGEDSVRDSVRDSVKDSVKGSVKESVKTLNVFIEDLVLEGPWVPEHRHPELKASVQDELARLFRENGVSGRFNASGDVPRLTGGRLDDAGGGDPSQLGGQIARAVYEGIKE